MKLSDQCRVNRDQAAGKRDELLARQAEILARAEKRADKNLLASEQRSFDSIREERKGLDVEVRELTERLEDLLEDEARDARATESRKLYGGGSTTPRGGEVYKPQGEHSFFKDLRNAKLGDIEAMQRLAANDQEARALGNTGGTGGSGGEFAPPGFLVDQFVELARAGRVMADRTTRDTLPSRVSSINIPKVATGTTTAVQSTQNTALASTDPTTSELTSAITSIGGKNVVSQQLLDQSAIPFDRMILGDLAADYARSLGLQVISGSGTAGQLLGAYTYFSASGSANYTYTQTTPAVAGTGGFYAAINNAISKVSTTRFLPPTCILMHPRRWSWVAGSFDGNNRPLGSPSGNAFNQIADARSVAAQGWSARWRACRSTSTRTFLPTSALAPTRTPCSSASSRTCSCGRRGRRWRASTLPTRTAPACCSVRWATRRSFRPGTRPASRSSPVPDSSRRSSKSS
jgi:HK97 family phage major capsid protein